MKWLIAFIFSITFSSVIFVPPVFAHAGPPFVLINGDYSQTNTIALNTYSNAFQMGQDIATQSAVVNTPVQFNLDLNNFPTPIGTDPYAQQTQSAQAIHKWDFGDGTHATGVSATHAYKKPGTYIVNILVDYPDKTSDFVSVNTVQLTVTPSKNYALPRPKLSVNGVNIKNPSSDIISFSSGKLYRFDASASTGNKLSYQWDFGDGSKGTGATVDHTYTSDSYTTLGILREKDADGIIVDTPFTLTSGSGISVPPVSQNIFSSFIHFIKSFLHLS